MTQSLKRSMVSLKLRNNAIFEQARFNGATTSEMIRDRIVVGIRNYQTAYR